MLIHRIRQRPPGIEGAAGETVTMANNLLKHEIDNAFNELDICRRKFEEKSADAAACVLYLTAKYNTAVQNSARYTILDECWKQKCNAENIMQNVISNCKLQIEAARNKLNTLQRLLVMMNNLQS